MYFILIGVLYISYVLSQTVPFELDPVFGSNMVLQRSPDQTCLFGTANPGSYVYIELESKTTKGRPEKNGDWIVCIPPHDPSDRSYTLTITNSDDSKIIKLTNILFGDVYICSGQSNMEFSMRDDFNSVDSFAHASDNRMIRFMTVERNPLPEPLKNISGHIRQKWSENNPANLGQGTGSFSYVSAVCYYFGLTIHQATAVPIGLIASSFGGTIVESWSPKIALDACTDKFNSTVEKNKHQYLWNGQIFPFRRMTIKGAIFYQGEDNVGVEGDYLLNKGYACSFPKMIEGWRKEFSTNGKTNPNFPFGFVQLSGYCNTGDHRCTLNKKVPELRFAQFAERYEVPNERLNNTFYASAIDLQDPLNVTSGVGDVHPRDKFDVGRRLGNAALKFVYGHDRPWTGPVIKSCVVDRLSHKITINVKEDYLKNEEIISKTPVGFEIYGTSWVPVNVTSVSKYSFDLDLPDNTLPTQIRYLWKENPCCPQSYGTVTPFSCPMKLCNIYSSRNDLPMTPFRAKIVNDNCDLS